MQKTFFFCLITLYLLAGSTGGEAAYLVHEHGVLPILTYKARVEINDQVAVTSLEMVFHNPNEHAIQAGLKFPISETAAIHKFSLTDSEGKVLDVSRTENNGPADTCLFETSTDSIAARARVTVMIEYSELLPYRSGKIGYTLPFAIKGIQETELETVSVNISITDHKEIASVVSAGLNASAEKNDKGTWNAVFEKNRYLPETDFMLNYELNAATPTVNFLATKPEIGQNGYFMLTFSPSEIISDKGIAMHDIVFVIDTSGSMAYDGDEIKQLFSTFIKQLNASDRFGIVAFSSLANTFMPELVPASEANRQTASDFINYLSVNNNTDIHQALLTALKLFDNAEGRVKTMILLTDGRAGTGIRDTGTIIRDFTANNTSGVRLFAFGVGAGVNVGFLNRLAAENRGKALCIGLSQDSEKKFMDFYESIRTPVLVDVALDWGGAEVSEVYPTALPNIYHGTRFTITGRYSEATSAEITLTGTLNSVKHSFPINATFVEQSEKNLFVQQLWAQAGADNITPAYAYVTEPQLNGLNAPNDRTIVRRSETRPLSFWGMYGFLPLAASALQGLGRTRDHNASRGCLANQRVLYSAIEMYNMDNNVMISELDQEAMDNLLKGQYLRSPIRQVDKDCCFSTTDALLREGKFICAVHGSVETLLQDNSDQQASMTFREGVFLEVIDEKQVVINKTEIIYEKDSWLKKIWNSWLADVVNLLINVPLFIIGLVFSLYLAYLILVIPYKIIAGIFKFFEGKES